jgi:hypothetical protein
MSRIKAYVVLAALLAAGCARSPEVADETADAAAAVTAAKSSGGVDPGTVVPNTVVDANELIANTPAPPICREVLKSNSNVHERRCMSAEHWKMWEQAEARRAAEIVRMMQGGAFR